MAKAEKSAKPKNLDELFAKIDKSIGSGSIKRGKNAITPVQVFSSGVASIDFALGCGGVPIGRIIEIWGPESSGKTTTCLQLAKACQQHYFPKKKTNGTVVYIDVEHSLDRAWAVKIGVDVDNMAISQPDSGEDAFSIIDQCIDSGLVDLIIVDSVAALVPQKVLEGDIGDQTMAALAQLMSKGLSKIKGKCNTTGTTVVFVNQIREKVGQMFGNPEVTPGGKALKFYATIRAEVKRKEAVKIGQEIVGSVVHLSIRKNKVAPPFEVAEYDICFGRKERPVCGIDWVTSLLRIAEKKGVLVTKGSFYKFEDRNLGNGESAVAKTLRDDSKLIEQVRAKLYELIVDGGIDSAEDIEEDGGFVDEQSTV